MPVNIEHKQIAANGRRFVIRPQEFPFGWREIQSFDFVCSQDEDAFAEHVSIGKFTIEPAVDRRWILGHPLPGHINVAKGHEPTEDSLLLVRRRYDQAPVLIQIREWHAMFLRNRYKLVISFPSAPMNWRSRRKDDATGVVSVPICVRRII